MPTPAARQQDTSRSPRRCSEISWIGTCDPHPSPEVLSCQKLEASLQMQSFRSGHPSVPTMPSALSNKYGLDRRLVGQPGATEGASRATLPPLQPPDGVLSRDFGQFNVETVPSSYYQRNQSNTGDHLNPLAPSLHPVLAQAPTDPSLFQHQSQVTTEASLFRQQIRHLPADATPFCHQSEQSQFQPTTSTPAFLQNQNQLDAAVMYQHQSQLSTESALYQRSSEQPLYHHSNQTASETSLYHQSQPSADNSLYQHPNQRVAETAVFRDHQAISEGPLYHQSLEATIFQNHRPQDASVFHHVNQATAEASLFHPNHPPTDAAVYHTPEAALYHHQSSLSGPTSNFLHQSSSASAPQATAFFHQTPAAAENSNIFRFPSQAGDTHFQRQNQLNPPFYHIPNQAAVETQYHHQQNQTESPFHMLQNQRSVDSQLQNSGPVDTTFYPHRNVDMGEQHHCQPNPISAEAQVFQFQNQPAQDSQLHQHSRVPSEVPLYQYQGQVASETQLHHQNHSTMDVSIVSYQNHISQEPPMHHRNHADMSVYHYPNQVTQDMQLRHQTQGSTEASQFHFQNQASLGTHIHPPSLPVSKSQSHRHQKLTSEEGSRNLSLSRFHSRPLTSSSDAVESKHYGPKRSNDSYVSSMKSSVDLSDMQRAYVKDASKAGNSSVTGALLCQPNYNSAAMGKPNDIYNVKERPETHFSWQKNRKDESNICQIRGLYSQNEDKMKNMSKQREHENSKPSSVFRTNTTTNPPCQDIGNVSSVDGRSSCDAQGIDFGVALPETSQINVMDRGNVTAPQTLADTNVLEMDHALYGDCVTFKVQSREEPPKNEYSVILESCGESASNQLISMGDPSIFYEISTDEGKPSSEHGLKTNEVPLCDSSNEILLFLEEQTLTNTSVETKCTMKNSNCSEAAEKDKLESPEDSTLYQSSEKSDETITHCNAHLLPRPPDIFLTLPVITESENILSQFETDNSQHSTQATHPSQDGGDESGPVMGLLFEEINSSPPTPPLMTPPCVTPPPSSPPRNWSSTSPLSCSPSSPKYATPAFLSPLSSSPRADEAESLVDQSDRWDQSQAKTQSVQEINSDAHLSGSMADAINKLKVAGVHEDPPAVSATASPSSDPGRAPFSTEQSSKTLVAEEINEAFSSLSFNEDLEVKSIIDSIGISPIQCENPTTSSGVEDKANPCVELADTPPLSPSPVKSGCLYEVMDNLNLSDTCKTYSCSQSNTLVQSESLAQLPSSPEESYSQEKPSDCILSSIAVAVSDTSSIDSTQVLPLAPSQSSKGNGLSSTISPLHTPGLLGPASKLDEEDHRIDRSSDLIQNEELCSNSENVAPTDESVNSVGSSVTQSILNEETESSMNCSVIDALTVAGVSTLIETDLPPDSVSSEQELSQMDDAVPASSKLASQPQGEAPPASIIVSGFLAAQQCLKL